MSAAATVKRQWYEMRPNKLGKEVYGIDLKNTVSEDCKQQIIKVEKKSPSIFFFL